MMKKKAIVSVLLVFIFFITIVNILIIHKKEETFYLEDKYYGTNTMTEIKIPELNQLIEDKESFALFVYQPMCVTSSDFESVLSNFLEEKKISIYKIAFSTIKDTEIGKKVKYYPSFLIYNKGKMMDFLEADKDEDVTCYTSKEGFEKWFTKYVKLKENSFSEFEMSKDNTIKEENDVSENIILENVKREKGKVNIYFFWGQGCPHCEEEFKFFESIKEKYGTHYNLYTFETWYNKENAKLVSTFASKMKDKVTGVPYTIIGNKSFNGFGEISKNDFIDAIESQYKNSYDVYFDKIKNT